MTTNTLTDAQWRYRQQAAPRKAHLWMHANYTRCGYWGPAVGGNYTPREDEKCLKCLRKLQR